MCNSEPAEAMTCQQAGLQSTTRASSDPAPPPSLSPLALGGCILISKATASLFSGGSKTSLFHPQISASFHLHARPPPPWAMKCWRTCCRCIYHTLSSTQQNRLISSRSITESPLEDTSRQSDSVAAELLRAARVKWRVR